MIPKSGLKVLDFGRAFAVTFSPKLRWGIGANTAIFNAVMRRDKKRSLSPTGSRGQALRAEEENGIVRRFPMDLTIELQRIYDSEINVSIGWVWDGGIEVRLGDPINGFLAEETVPSTDEIVPWLQEAIAHFYPDSTYAKCLPIGIVERARTRLFLPPQIGAQVRCPSCGAPHAALPGMTELFAFICAHCGQAVTFKQPPTQ